MREADHGMQLPQRKARRAMSSKHASLGLTRYRGMDGSSDYAAIVTNVDSFGECCLTVWLPNIATPQLLTRVPFDPHATPETVKPGTCYQW
jgi:hypothetical protein